jgi:S-adenosylmethionine hydrolase
MRHLSGVITLLTDYGARDAYAGVLHGVILGINPRARIVDLTHEVPAQDVAAGAWQLRTAAPYFPDGTVHCAVVDPGVGTGRRAIAAFDGRDFFVGPDNGVLSWAVHLEEADVHALSEERFHVSPISSTFHGRDVFAPVAAHLSLGVDSAELGPRVDDPVVLPILRPRVVRDALEGEVLLADGFGNLITSIDRATFDGWGDGVDVEIAGRRVRLVHAYADAAESEVVALFGSAGHLEIAVRDGSAAVVLGGGPGAPVRVTR